jgi:hypothetical protein
MQETRAGVGAQKAEAVRQQRIDLETGNGVLGFGPLFHYTDRVYHCFRFIVADNPAYAAEIEDVDVRESVAGIKQMIVGIFFKWSSKGDANILMPTITLQKLVSQHSVTAQNQ